MTPTFARGPCECKKCGSPDTEIVARSGTPAMLIVRCRVCGLLFSAPADPPPGPA